jgi:dual-specificity kinase
MMSTPSTAIATLPPHQPHYGYLYHQNYQASLTGPRAVNPLLNAVGRPGSSYSASNTTNGLTTNAVGSANPTSTVPPHSHSIPRINNPQATMPTTQSQSTSENGVRKKRPRSREPDWHTFYKNGLPKEVIVIDDSPSPPRVSDSVEPASNMNAKYQPSRTLTNGTNRHVVKKRKRGDTGSGDLVYVQDTPSMANTPHLQHSASGSTISTDRTTSAIHTTAATSLGSQYSHNGGVYDHDDVQPGQKRKRVATRQQLAAEAKRRELEIHGDAYSSYKPPPRPPIKAGDVHVKQVHDVSCSKPVLDICMSLIIRQHSYTKDRKVDDEDGHYIVIPDTDLTERCKLCWTACSEIC